MEDNMHALNGQLNSMFDGLALGAQQTQDAFNRASNAFQTTNDGPRRTDGYYQQPAPQYNGGYGAPQYQVPPTYGYGYTERSMYNNGNPFGQPQANAQSAYYGFYNPAYGK